jgi:hypothetical protein
LDPAPLRRAGAAACLLIVDFRIRPPWPVAATKDENRGILLSG